MSVISQVIDPVSNSITSVDNFVAQGIKVGSSDTKLALLDTKVVPSDIKIGPSNTKFALLGTKVAPLDIKVSPSNIKFALLHTKIVLL
jgi:hypothetical protein